VCGGGWVREEEESDDFVDFIVVLRGECELCGSFEVEESGVLREGWWSSGRAGRNAA
jgi:hypothetical protein